MCTNVLALGSGASRAGALSMSFWWGRAGEQALLVCRVGSRLCGIPLVYVVEIMRPLPLEPLKEMPPFVVGLTLLRGRPTPVVDGRWLFGGSEARSSSAGRSITLAVGQRRVALLVDDIVHIRPLASVQLDELPPLLQKGGDDAVSLGRLDSELLLVLQHTRLLSEQLLDSLVTERA